MKVHTRTSFPAFTIASYVVSSILIMCFVLAAVATWSSISAQLAQGVPLQGNELAIVNVVLSGCASYAAFAFLAFAAGTLYRKFERHTEITPNSDTSVNPEADEDTFWDEDVQETSTPSDEEAKDNDPVVRSVDLTRVFGACQTVTLDQALKGVYTR